LKTGGTAAARRRQRLSSPVDGTLSQFGANRRRRFDPGQGPRLHGAELLADDDLAARFWTAASARSIWRRITITACTCRSPVLRRWSYIPGRLSVVNPSTARALPKLFARNERMVACFDTDFGPLAW